MIHPHSDFKRRWDLLGLLIVLYCSIDLPLDIAYYPNIEVNAGFVVNCIFDAFFICDIIINFFTGYDFHGVTVLEPKACRDHYFYDAFKYDLVASLPIDYFAFINNGNANLMKAPRLIRVLRMFRLVRLFRLPRIFRYTKRFTEKINVGIMRILKLVFLLCLFCHWNGCLLFLVSSLDGDNPKRWIALMDIEDSSVITQYTWSLFMSISHMLCIGYGVYPPETTAEVWATIYSMMLGAGLFANIVGSITAVLLSLDSASANYQGYVNEMNAYFRHLEVSPDLRLRVNKYLSMRWAHDLNERVGDVVQQDDMVDMNGLKMYDEDKILSYLSPALRLELGSLHCSAMLGKNPVFNKSFFPPTLARWMASVLMPCTYLHEDTVIAEGEPPTRIFFIRQGKAEISIDGTRYGTTFDGSYIGELPFVFSDVIHAQPFHVVAASAVFDAYYWTEDDFKKTLKHFPDLLEIMRLVARQRLKKLELDDKIPTDKHHWKHKEALKRDSKDQAARIVELEDLFMGQAAEQRFKMKRQSTVASQGEAMRIAKESVNALQGKDMVAPATVSPVGYDDRNDL
jgi:hypothetical protein